MSILGKIALQNKLITQDAYNQAVSLCKSDENFDDALKNHFIRNNLIKEDKIKQILHTISTLKIIKRNMRFGDVAIKLKLIDKNTLQAALLKQKIAAKKKEDPKPIGKILFESEKLSKKQIALIIHEQKKMRLKLNAIKENLLKEKKETKSLTSEIKNSEETKTTDAINKSEKSITNNGINKPVPKIKKDFQTSEKVLGGMILKTDETGMAAYLFKTDEFNSYITADDIYTILAEKMIQFGITKKKLINIFIKSRGFKQKPFLIATGMDMVQGKDARIEYYFDTDYLKAGNIDEEGGIDFRERGKIPNIDENTLLAEKFPLKEAKNGRDIFGNELFALPVKDLELKTETGAYLSEDGTKLYSYRTGFPKLTWSGNVNVLDVFLIEGDVGFETGHVIYDGNIEVAGCLKSGFQIKGFNVKIVQIDGGKIIANGDVTITNGVNNATIHSRGHVFAKFVHNSSISCLGNFNVEKEIVDSIIETSGACMINHGQILNSQIISNRGVQAKNIGSDRTDPNRITVGEDVFLDHDLKQIDKNINSIELKISKLQNSKEKLIDDNKKYHQASTQILNQLEICRSKKKAIQTHINGIDNVPGKNKKLKTFQDELEYNTDLFNKLDKEFNDKFDIVGKSESQIHDINTVFSKFEDQLSDLHLEKLNLIAWGKANKENSEIIVDGKIYENTLIKGKHSKNRLKDTVSRVKINEVLSELNIYEVQINENI